MTDMKCACPCWNAYDCWSVRNNTGPCEYDRPSVEMVERDGGPCMCSCHDDVDEDQLA